MAKIQLNVVDPQKYDSGTAESPVLMTYAGDGSPIVIDTDTAFLECESQGKSASINKWKADYSAHKMKLAEDADEGDYREIDLVAAMGIAGQLVKEIGVGTLQTLLKTLNEVYSASKTPEGGDAQLPPTNNSPSTPEPPIGDNMDNNKQ